MAHATSPYQIRFTRYNRKTCERRLSDVAHVSVASFAEAVAYAGLMLRGMQSADPESDYEIMSVVADGLGGVDCLGGGTRLWETAGEWQERFEKESGK